MIYIGADHRGFEYKEKIKNWLASRDIKFEDMGAIEIDNDDDFVDFAQKISVIVSQDSQSRGILLCNNGVGMDIVANKFKNVRSVLGFDAEQVKLARSDDDVNVLSLPAGFILIEKAYELIDIFLNTDFSGEDRFKRRLDKIQIIENGD